MTIEQVNSYSARNAILGWLVGIAYYGWWAASAPSIPFWGWAVLIVAGMYAASIVVGGSLGLIAASITKLVLGSAGRSPNAYAWAAFFSPVIAFWSAGWVIRAAFG